MKTASDRIKDLIDGELKPPYLWNALAEIRQTVISLEIQIEDLEEINRDLVDQVTVGDGSSIDLAVIRTWEAAGSPGDPPEFIQNAFDREQVRQLEVAF